MWRQPERLVEWCTIGWGAELHSQGSLEGGVGPQEKQSTIVGEGERRRLDGNAFAKSFSAHERPLRGQGDSGSEYRQ